MSIMVIYRSFFHKRTKAVLKSTAFVIIMERKNSFAEFTACCK